MSQMLAVAPRGLGLPATRPQLRASHRCRLCSTSTTVNWLALPAHGCCKALVVEERGTSAPCREPPAVRYAPGHTVHQHRMDRTIADFQRGAFRPDQLTERVVLGLAGLSGSTHPEVA